MNDGMSSEHFFWNVQIHTAFSYAQALYLCGFEYFFFCRSVTHLLFKTINWREQRVKKSSFEHMCLIRFLLLLAIK
jgi:hypothetical protein